VAGLRAGLPRAAQAPTDAPNIVYIVLDNVGYGWCDTFGGLVETPHITRLAANGLPYISEER
jgi:arylsulfatase